MKTNCTIVSWLALPALAITLSVPFSNLGAADFVSLHGGSWFDAVSTWGQASFPGNGDNVEISAAVDYVVFDPSTSGLSVTVSNLYLNNGTLWVNNSPSTLTMAGSKSLFMGTNYLNGVGGVLHNQGKVFQSSAGTLNIGNQTSFENQLNGIYNFDGDGVVTGSGYSSFNNYGRLRKSGGIGISVFDSHVDFNNLNGVIEVDSGTLSLASGGTSSSGTFIVASGAVLDLTGGNGSTWSGLVTGSGAGTVSLSNGQITTSPSLTLNLPDGLFQWTGGTLWGTTINSGVVTVAGFGSVNMNGVFYNNVLLHHTNTATLNIGGNSTFEIQVGGTYNLEGDGGVTGMGYSYFNNHGLLRKSGGNGTSSFNSSVSFDNLNGSIEVDSGTLSLAGNGVSSNGTFIVTSGAVLDLTGGQGPTWAGLVSGSGAGTVSLSSGTLSTSPSLTLNLPTGLFQWTGGTLSGTTINSNAVTVAGSGSVYVGGVFYNYGLMHHTNTATLHIGAGPDTTFANQAGGIYNLEGDGGFFSGGNASFNNHGLLRKSGGNGTSSFGFNNGVAFNNVNGVIEVDSGTLSLNSNGSSSNGTFSVASEAVLDLTGGQGPTWAGLVGGSGAGTVSLSSGTISSSPSLTLNLPAGLFHWTGGTLSGTTINSNVVTVAGSGSLNLGGVFYNYGLVHHTNTATLHIGYNSTFENQAGGTYNLEGDGGFYSDGYGYFNNSGLLRKSGGNGISSFINGVAFNNLNGSIEVDSGQLSLNGQSYAQGSGSFIVTLGGTNAGQSGQLLCGPATLGGPLTVKLAGGYVPALGDRFQILSSGGLGGGFTTLNVPGGIAVTYTNNSVFLTVTGTVTGKLVGPAVAGNNFTFSVVTISNQSYTIQRNDDLTTANWIFFTNFTGDGSLMQVVSPVTNAPQRYFRLRQP
jgi:hypothetical protein